MTLFNPALRTASYDHGVPYTQAFDNTGGSTSKLTLYVGKAQPGSAKSSAVWQIYKLTYDANDNVTDIQWANGALDFNNVWNDRATFTYS